MQNKILHRIDALFVEMTQELTFLAKKIDLACLAFFAKSLGPSLSGHWSNFSDNDSLNASRNLSLSAFFCRKKWYN